MWVEEKSLYAIFGESLHCEMVICVNPKSATFYRSNLKGLSREIEMG
jgi:hypothetical protein